MNYFELSKKNRFLGVFCLKTDKSTVSGKESTISGNESTFLGIKSTILEGNIPILHTIGGRAYPVRHYPLAIRLRTREEYAILCIALNPQSGDFSGAILGVRSVALLHLGSSLVRPWFFTRRLNTRYKGTES